MVLPCPNSAVSPWKAISNSLRSKSSGFPCLFLPWGFISLQDYGMFLFSGINGPQQFYFLHFFMLSTTHPGNVMTWSSLHPIALLLIKHHLQTGRSLYHKNGTIKMYLSSSSFSNLWMVERWWLNEGNFWSKVVLKQPYSCPCIIWKAKAHAQTYFRCPGMTRTHLK